MRKVVFSLMALFVALSLFGAMNVSAQCQATTAATTSSCAATTCAQCTSCTTSTCCCCPTTCPTACPTVTCPAVACCVVTSCCPTVHEFQPYHMQDMDWD